MKIGLGYDSHRFEEGRALFLGGVQIPGAVGLKGHSDADVLIHAVIDSLLGAAALGDIGSHFPDTDAKWKGADSAELLRTVVAEVRSAGYRVGNIDAIRARLAGLLGTDVGCVSVKGKTNEKMDDVGAGVGIEVHCVALLENE